MPQPRLKICPDPKCGKESPEESETCIGCGLNFAGFELFDRAMDVRERRKEEEKKKTVPPPAKTKSLLDVLRGK